ncbi:hypothetical protein L3C95_23060 [Chitinophaga filiformis]|uniref:hypothetical protein n=1 Tax=Chitinophaga filiformis TaxID=104663 RepID=UPI001F24AC43|nr:hypothetical protein [Chitinophaga filiformis]MCF6405797.1 hypothetical protein [Chitinophaga filiformis]
MNRIEEKKDKHTMEAATSTQRHCAQVRNNARTTGISSYNIFPGKTGWKQAWPIALRAIPCVQTCCK